jgi:hypothetical protein
MRVEHLSSPPRLFCEQLARYCDTAAILVTNSSIAMCAALQSHKDATKCPRRRLPRPQRSKLPERRSCRQMPKLRFQSQSRPQPLVRQQSLTLCQLTNTAISGSSEMASCCWRWDGARWRRVGRQGRCAPLSASEDAAGARRRDTATQRRHVSADLADLAPTQGREETADGAKQVQDHSSRIARCREKVQ